MSAGGDFIGGDYESEPNYPVVFGVSLTPTLSGILLALAGLAGAGAILSYLVMPEWNTNQELQAKVEQARTEVNQKAEIARQIEAARQDLETAKKQQQEVRALFATPASLDTLSLDLNRQVDARNFDVSKRLDQRLAACPPIVRQELRDFEKKFGAIAAKAEVTKFERPKDSSSIPKDGIVTDGAYGPQVNNKLKREMFEVNLSANPQQTAAILESIERLQPLLIVRGFKSALDDKVKNTTFYSLPSQQLSPCQLDPKLNTAFYLEALVPLTPDELAKASAPSTQPAAAQPAKPAKK